MTAEEHHHQRLLRFARIRRLKLLLRYMPRRARFHTYPLVGRFASFARARNYLWTFRYEAIRPAFYLGSILTLMPVLGQLPIAFALCLAFRTNFMILGGLQFVSNFVTLPFIMAGTLKLGLFVLHHTGLERFTGLIPVSATEDPTGAVATVLVEPSLGHKVVLYGSALVIGGLIVGLVLGTVCDLLWRYLVLPAAKLRQTRKPVTAIVTPHDNPPPPPAS